MGPYPSGPYAFPTAPPPPAPPPALCKLPSGFYLLTCYVTDETRSQLRALCRALGANESSVIAHVLSLHCSDPRVPKQAGQERKWVNDSKVTYEQAVQLHPDATVIVRWVEGSKSKGPYPILRKPVQAVPTFDQLIVALKNSYGKPISGRLEWIIGTDQQPMVARGAFHLVADKKPRRKR